MFPPPRQLPIEAGLRASTRLTQIHLSLYLEDRVSLVVPHAQESHLSELAGRLVTGLKMHTRSKQQYSR